MVGCQEGQEELLWQTLSLYYRSVSSSSTCWYMVAGHRDAFKCLTLQKLVRRSLQVLQLPPAGHAYRYCAPPWYRGYMTAASRDKRSWLILLQGVATSFQASYTLHNQRSSRQWTHRSTTRPVYLPPHLISCNLQSYTHSKPYPNKTNPQSHNPHFYPLQTTQTPQFDSIVQYLGLKGWEEPS